MKPRVKLATAATPDGGEMELYQHDCDFSIMVNGEDLMHSRRHQSELELAQLGCGHLVGGTAARVLIGGLGMGYTLRRTLDLVGPDGQVVVAELLPAVVDWNRQFLGELNDRPLEDERVVLKTGDIVEFLSSCQGEYDSILLDIDNGPEAMTYSGNHRLYGYEGILSCQCALRKHGCLAVWSAKPSKEFEQLLMSCGFYVSRYRVPAHKGKKPPSHFVWLASEDRSILPPGGGEPRGSAKHKTKGRRRRPQGRR